MRPRCLHGTPRGDAARRSALALIASYGGASLTSRARALAPDSVPRRNSSRNQLDPVFVCFASARTVSLPGILVCRRLLLLPGYQTTSLSLSVGCWTFDASPRCQRPQGEGVRGADLVFACIGPALERFSRFRRVKTAGGREIALAEFLDNVWEVVGRAALAQAPGTAEAQARDRPSTGSGFHGAGAPEEDARLNALFLWTLQSALNGNERNGAPARDDDHDDDAAAMDDEGDDADDARPAQQKKDGGYVLVFDVVRRFAQPPGIDLARWEGRIIATEKGVVRQLPVRDRT
ncbi:MAG: hypothetical protein NZ699_16160 [Roseiflexus sp.]|nr:hypothetical protein [Roseiflexus sp.]